ncbi:hypothetical protein E2C01_079128 [Portunus trituberculatus]|uniref:Uncharacterized protein n=1 Tax=Portunus trituberculatus TaxID=210409 RepID=A0A5B7IIU4_PORTR|nr:hypothetical protein [Portunus trituberculatus]
MEDTAALDECFDYRTSCFSSEANTLAKNKASVPYKTECVQQWMSESICQAVKLETVGEAEYTT